MLAKKRFLSPSSPRKWKEKRLACNSCSLTRTFPEPLPDILNYYYTHLILTKSEFLLLLDDDTDPRSRDNKAIVQKVFWFCLWISEPLVFDNSLQLVLWVASIYCSVSGWFYFFFRLSMLFTTFAPMFLYASYTVVFNISVFVYAVCVSLSVCCPLIFCRYLFCCCCCCCVRNLKYG